MNTVMRNLHLSSYEKQWDALVDIRRLHQMTTKSLIRYLTDEDKWVRFVAARTLGNLKEREAADQLIGLLKDQDQDVRYAATEALGKIRAKTALDQLSRIKNSDTPCVRQIAHEAVTRIIFLDQLEKEYLTGTHGNTMEYAMR